jgi:hypothetical protein
MFKMRTSVKMVQDNTADLLKAVTLLEKKQVLVGVPVETAEREVDPDSPINNAALAYIHNYGSPTQNIPPRPFLEPGIKNAQADIVAQFRKAGEAALDARPDGVTKGFIAAGIVAVSGVKSKITMGPFEPLAPSTLAARRRKGRTGTSPLIDTGALRNSINYVVRDK